MAKRFVKIITAIEHGMQYLANVIVLVVAIVVTAEVFSRRVLHYSIPGSFETGEQSLVFIIYLGLAFCQSERGHLRVGMLIERSRGRTRQVWEAIALIVPLLISIVLLWQTGVYGLIAFHQREYSPGMINYPVWPGKLIVPVGLFFLCIRILIQMAEHIANARRGVAPVTEEITPESGGAA